MKDDDDDIVSSSANDADDDGGSDDDDCGDGDDDGGGDDDLLDEDGNRDWAKVEEQYGRAYVEAELDPYSPDPRLEAYLNETDMSASNEDLGLDAMGIAMTTSSSMYC